MLYYSRYRSAVEKSSRQCLVTTFFMSSFEVLHMEIMFTKETGHLYWVSMLRMRIAAIYTEGSAFRAAPMINHLFIKRRLKIIHLAVWRYI